jgi:2-amino-4-hydroxy-6-hydroxymethyldihydropteridine diphosphokinase
VSRAFLSLGSNLGDREEYLRAIIRALRNGPRVEVVGVSRVYETEPVEVEAGQPDYLNCVVAVEYGASALELLRFCQGVECALGRERREGVKTARTADIDVLTFGREVIEGADLTVPHPGVVRAFNLRALADLAPELEVPGYGVVEELLAEADLSGVREYGRV